MAVIMVPFWIFIVFSIVGSNATGQFNVLHSPGSLKFYGSAELQESNLKEVFSASLGLAVEENSDWNGLTVTDPFSTPEAIVEVYVDGVTSLSSAFGAKAAVYPLIVDEYEPDTFDSMKHRINQRCTNGACKLVNILLNNIAEVKSYPDVFGDIVPLKHSKQSLIHLKTSCEEDKLFLTELENLKAITNTIKSGAISPDNNVDFYNLRFTSLHAMSDFHGPNSLPLKEAKTLLGEALLDLKDALQKAYEGSVLVTVVCTDVVHTRRTISKRQAAPSQQTEPLTAATQTSNSYPADYAAIFNILLWFGVIFTFTLVAIVYAIMDMDPGRDSIIYRMTSTRMKKDN